MVPVLCVALVVGAVLALLWPNRERIRLMRIFRWLLIELDPVPPVPFAAPTPRPQRKAASPLVRMLRRFVRWARGEGLSSDQ